MSDSLEAEVAWLNHLKASMLVGTCIIDAEGQPVQRYTDDLDLRQILLDYQDKKVRRLQAKAEKPRKKRSTTGRLKPPSKP